MPLGLCSPFRVYADNLRRDLSNATPSQDDGSVIPQSFVQLMHTNKPHGHGTTMTDILPEYTGQVPIILPHTKRYVMCNTSRTGNLSKWVVYWTLVSAKHSCTAAAFILPWKASLISHHAICLAVPNAAKLPFSSAIEILGTVYLLPLRRRQGSKIVPKRYLSHGPRWRQQLVCIVDRLAVLVQGIASSLAYKQSRPHLSIRLMMTLTSYITAKSPSHSCMALVLYTQSYRFPVLNTQTSI
ncbi:hypothetical protein B0H63DRAFT_114004 [Podospora didyma]|uniref:Uncharacterized protein n=1 Tax=Podospora didyma TaxID=330526 RepID=A0AAE0NZ18_9PEZI|nr:hypothetical protein B0H63DRAFT_114004 [Podospora didyma]